MSMSRHFAIAAAALVVSATTLHAQTWPAPNGRDGFVTASALNLRASHPGPKSHGAIWIPLPRCTRVEVHLEKLYEGEPWLLVTYEHLTGWVYGVHIANSLEACEG